jgi:hypothetical protein
MPIINKTFVEASQKILPLNRNTKTIDTPHNYINSDTPHNYTTQADSKAISAILPIQKPTH